MKFLISFVALALVAVSVDAGFDAFPEDQPEIKKIGDVQKSIGNINLAATDLNTIEKNLEPLTVADNLAKVQLAETAVKEAVDKDAIKNDWVTPKKEGE